jgi:hypothetical protein
VGRNARSEAKCRANPAITNRAAAPAMSAKPGPEKATDRGALSRALALAAAGAVLLAAPTATLALDAVAPTQMLQLAKPLPKPQQTVDKGQVWTVCVGGAAVLFVSTVVAENNEVRVAGSDVSVKRRGGAGGRCRGRDTQIVKIQFQTQECCKLPSIRPQHSWRLCLP